MNRREQIQRSIDEVEDRSLETSRRCLNSIYDTERIAVDTADELHRQGEQLRNVEETVDNMNSQMDVTQRHLNNIKSVFGGVVNWWQGLNKAKPTPSSQPADTATSSRLVTSDSYNPPGPPRQPLPATAGAQMQSSARSIEIDRNLDELGDGILRLQGLARGLGSELDAQNDVLDRIEPKTAKLKDRMTYQQQQMDRILKK